MIRLAHVSPCGTWRYTLERIWDESKPMMVMLGLNPSKADAEVDDPTTVRSVNFAKRERCGRLLMMNPFAFRATRPKDMFAAPDPCGPKNVDVHYARLVCSAMQGSPDPFPHIVVAGWGSQPKVADKLKVYTIWLKAQGVPLKCLGFTKDGSPRHPLYVRADAPLLDF